MTKAEGKDAKMSWGMDGGWGSNLLSGFAGALVVQVLSMVWGEIKRRKERESLLKGTMAECEYNLSILDEITTLAIRHSGTFKRMSVDYFRSIREQAARFDFDKDLIAALSRTCIDLDLFNRELDCIFDGKQHHHIYSGIAAGNSIQITRKHEVPEIKPIIHAARQGVASTLKHLLETAESALNPRKNDDE